MEIRTKQDNRYAAYNSKEGGITRQQQKRQMLLAFMANTQLIKQPAPHKPRLMKTIQALFG